MSFDEVLEKIVEETEADKEDIQEEVDEKMDEFEGLVSEEGAIHLVAKEYGVDVQEAASKDLEIENIVPEMRKVNLKARVVRILDKNTFERDEEEEDGQVQNIVLGDDTGTIRVTLWDEQTQIAEKIEEGDPIKISGAYTVEDDQGNAEIRLGDESQVAMADEEEVPEVESRDSSTTEAKISQIETENGNFKAKGMLMAVYTNNPFFKVDPETGDTLREDEDGNLVTEEGKEVEEPEYRLAVSGVIDDGTGALRTVFFGEQARKVLEIDEETEKEGKKDDVEEAADEVLGKELEVEGRTRYNDYFDQIELLVNSVNQIEASEELEELLELMEA